MGRAQQIAKDFDSGTSSGHGLLCSTGFGIEEKVMTERTCAACDCKLEENAVRVKIGGKTVEVCCDDCAQKLKEADRSARSTKS
jgi:hypothetical protein